VKLSVGMKFDLDAVNILRKFKTIYLHDKKNELLYIQPEIAKSFEQVYESICLR
jgi:hypothetical protein